MTRNIIYMNNIIINISQNIMKIIVDPPLLETEMSKLNKLHISGREFY